MRIYTFITAASAAIVAISSAANASPAGTGTFREDVSYADLDLTTREGVARLERRIDSAIDRVCNTGQRDLGSLRFEQDCRQGALAYAKADIRLAVASANADKVRLAEAEEGSSQDAPGA